jgi:hypothetical protein
VTPENNNDNSTATTATTTTTTAAAAAASGAKKVYKPDFLLSFQARYTDKPEGNAYATDNN